VSNRAIFNANCTGQEQTVTATLSATPWTALNPRLAVPEWATRAVLTAPVGRLRYLLNGDPGGAPSGTASAGATMSASTEWVIDLALGNGRTLGLSSEVASAVVRVVWLP